MLHVCRTTFGRQKGAKIPTIAIVWIDREKLQQLRRDKFLSRSEVAERAGLHYDHIDRED